MRAAARDAADIGYPFDMGAASERGEAGGVERSMSDGQDASYFATALTWPGVTGVAELPHELLMYVIAAAISASEI